jgi:VanZ family protein
MRVAPKSLRVVWDFAQWNPKDMNDLSVARRHAWLAFLAYLTFVVYGSLVPFEYRPSRFDEAVEQFARIGYFQLGIESRADWVANIVLYVPLAFLGCAGTIGLRSHGALRLLASLPVFAFCLAVAVAVEFTQIFFAPRTVSLNDLFAESLGSGLGIALFFVGRRRLARLLEAFAQGGRPSVVAVITLYASLYVAISLFPYDFVISADELAWKLKSGMQGWFWAGECGGLLRCGVRQIAEAGVIMPLGLLLALAAPKLGYRRVFLMGVGLGAVLETVQLFLASGISQGVSLLWRGAGLAAGLAVGRVLGERGSPPVIRLLRQAIPVAVWPYLFLLAALNGWFSASWLPTGEALARLAGIRLMPFYYHYFTTETEAMASLLAQAGLYAPVGLLAWVWRASPGRARPAHAALAAASLALPVEFGKLWVASRHPDFTNLLIAAASAAFVCALANWLERVLSGGPRRHEDRGRAPIEPVPMHASEQWSLSVGGDALLLGTGANEDAFGDFEAANPGGAPSNHPEVPLRDQSDRGRSRSAANTLVAAISASALAWFVVRYPLGWYWPAALSLVYWVLLYRMPALWLVMVPAAIPLLDLSPWTGRFFFDEFDALILATTAWLGWRGLGILRFDTAGRRPWLMGLFALSTAIALIIGLSPLQAMDLNAFNSYYSPYNALRVAKGFAWSLLVAPYLMGETDRNFDRTNRLLVTGMVLGVLLGSIPVLWERLAFTGLWNFSDDYRVAGAFSGMHTGGAYVEGYFVTALPFVVWWVIHRRSILEKGLGVVACAMGAYSVMVTFARGGYIALALSLSILALVAWWHGGKPRSRLPWRWVGVTAIVMVLSVLAVLTSRSSYMTERWSSSAGDAVIRQSHWRDAWVMAGDDLTTRFLGMGLGRYPVTYYLLNSQNVKPAHYRFEREPENTLLVLSAGDALYFEQLITPQAHRRYRLSLSARSDHEMASLSVPVCEKWMLYSARCHWIRFDLGDSKGQWVRLEKDIDMDSIGNQPWPKKRTVKLVLLNQNEQASVAIDDISLKDPGGNDLVRNGSFARGMDHWYFATDNHLPWHVKNLWVHVWFEQGLAGVMLFSVIALRALGSMLGANRNGRFPAPAIVAGLSGFLMVGAVDTLLDVPRVAFLFYLLVFWALAVSKPRAPRNRAPFNMKTDLAHHLANP